MYYCDTEAPQMHDHNPALFPRSWIQMQEPASGAMNQEEVRRCWDAD
jgi:hypothetical protein